MLNDLEMVGDTIEISRHEALHVTAFRSLHMHTVFTRKASGNGDTMLGRHGRDFHRTLEARIRQRPRQIHQTCQMIV